MHLCLGEAYRYLLTLVCLIRGQAPVLVYQMGKVGSKSVHRSLLSHGIWSIHIHQLLTEHQCATGSRHLGRLDRWWQRARQSFCRSFIQGRKTVRVITLVREPIARQISAFFENFERHTGLKPGQADLDPEELQRLYLGKAHFRHPQRWLEREMRPVLGIDVYAYPFPQQVGHLVIKQGNIELLILKLEIPDTIKEQAIAHFLGIPRLQLTRHNEARDKDYAETYRAFTEHIRLPKAYVDAMCDDRFTRHFYSQAEIEGMRSRWLRHAEAGPNEPAVASPAGLEGQDA